MGNIRQRSFVDRLVANTFGTDFHSRKLRANRGERHNGYDNVNGKNNNDAGREVVESGRNWLDNGAVSMNIIYKSF